MFQMRTVGTQIFLQRLLIADISEKFCKQPATGLFIDRDKKSALDHNLIECHRLEQYGLSPRIGSVNKHHPPVRSKSKIKRDRRSIKLRALPLHNRIKSPIPFTNRLFFDNRDPT